MFRNNKKSVICRATRQNLQYLLLWPKFEKELNAGREYVIKIAIYCTATGLLWFMLIAHCIVTAKSICLCNMCLNK